MPTKLLTILFTLFFALSIKQVNARTYYVNDASLVGDVYCKAIGNTMNDGLSPLKPKASLKQLYTTYNQFADGDTIYMDAGTYKAMSTSSLESGYTFSKNIVIIGAGSANTILDNNHKGNQGSNTYFATITGSVSIKNIQFKNYNYDNGGQVLNINSTGNDGVVLSDVFFNSNGGGRGNSAILIGSNCKVTISGNYMGASVCNGASSNYFVGGGIDIVGSGSVVNISNYAFVGNHKDLSFSTLAKGVALSITNANNTTVVNVSNSIFATNYLENISSPDGGTIYANSGVLNVTNCIFKANKSTGPTQANNYGVVVGLTGGTHTFKGCSFTDNVNSGESYYTSLKGCIGVNGATLNLEDCYFSGNVSGASNDVYLQAGSVTAKNTTFGSSGTSIRQFGGTFTISDCGNPIRLGTISLINSNSPSAFITPNTPIYSGDCTTGITVPCSTTLEYSTYTSTCTSGALSPTTFSPAGGIFNTSEGLDLNKTTGEINYATSTSGTYSVTYYAGGCSVSKTFNFGAGSLSGNQAICEGTTTTFVPSLAGGIWSSSNNGIASVNSAGLVTAIGIGTATIYYTVVGVQGCADAVASRTVTITAKPNAGTISGTTTLCDGKTSQLVSTATGGTWTSSATAIATINATSGLLTGVTVGSTTVTYTVVGTGGCSNATATKSITINGAASVGVLSGAQTICLAGTNTFTSTVSGGTWSSGDPSIATINSSSGLIKNIKAGTVTMTYTQAGVNGCPARTATQNLTITSSPSAGVISGNTSVCTGTTTTLTSNLLGGSWSSATTTVATVNASTGVVTPVAAGSSVITYTIPTTGGCAAASVTSSIVVNLSPTANAGVVLPAICLGSTTAAMGGSIGGGATGGNWSGGNGTWSNPSDLANATYKPSSLESGNITLTLTSNGGNCGVVTASKYIIVNTIPIANAGENLPSACQGIASQPMFGSIGGGALGGTWSGGQGTWVNASDPVNANYKPTSTENGNITVTLTANGGSCGSVTSSKTITVKSIPYLNPGLSLSSICPGGTTSAMEGNINYTSNEQQQEWTGINWVGGLGTWTNAFSPMSATYTASESESGPISLTLVANSINCGTIAVSKTIMVNSKDNSKYTYSQSSFCLSDADPNPNITGAKGGVFSSSPNGLVINTNTGAISLATSQTGSYAVTYTTNGYCPSSTSTNISVGSIPIVDALADQSICAGSVFNATNFTGNLGTMFSWTNSNSGIGLAASGSGNIPAFVGKNTGNSPVSSVITVTPQSGSCIGTSKSFTLTVQPKNNANFTYPSNSFCKTLDNNPQSIILGEKDGVFTASPSGLTLNPSTGLITLSSSAPGQYTIKYTTVNSCTNSDSMQITIGDNPAVNDITSQNQCIGSAFYAINFTGSPGSTFSWVNNTPSIGLAASGDGNIASFTGTGVSASTTSLTATITVTPLIGSCPGVKKSFTLTVQPKDIAQISYTSTQYCPSESDPIPVISGTTGGVFSATPTGLVIDANTGKISLANSLKGNYAVFYKTSGMCPSEMQWDINVGTTSSTNLSIVTSSGKNSFCVGDSLKLIAQGATKYLWNTGKKDNFITVKTPGKYTVSSNEGVCSNSVSLEIKVDTIRLSMSVPSLVGFNNGSIILNGTPKEGTFSGIGVNNNTFDPKLAGLGVKKITFSYVSPNNCSAQESQNILVYDTVNTNCTVTKYDTLKVTKYDTVTYTNNVTKYDTVKVTKYDTVTFTNNVTKYDTVKVTKYDTVKVTKFDTVTVKNNVYDTVTITNNVTKYDTVLVNKTIYDTVTFKNNVYDTITITNNVTKYDTLKVTKYDTLTIKNNVYDTVTITNNVTKYDTVLVTEYDTVTITNNVTKYDTITLTDTVSILKIKFKLTTGIQANQMASMSLYPNPTSDVLHIEVGDAKALEGYRYRILDALGKEVYNELVKNTITEIPLKTLGAAGMYQLEVLDQNNSNIQTNKIVLQ